MLQKSPDAPPRKSRYVPSRRGFLIGAGATLGLVVGYALWPRGGLCATTIFYRELA